MAIAAVSGQAGGATGASVAAIARAFPSAVSAGSLVVVVGFRYEPASDAYLAGDCTQSAGTATITAPLLHAQVNMEQPGHGWAQAGIWTALVTAGGSLTMQVGGGTTGGYPSIATHEFTGAFDGTRHEAAATNFTATNNTNPAHSNDATSAGHALFLGGLALNSTSPQTITPEAAFTQIYENEAGNTSQAGSAIFRIVSGGTTDRAEWTVPTVDNLGWAAAVAVIRETSATPTLVTQDISHAHLLDAVALTQAHQLAQADVQHGHLLDAAVLTQVHALAAEDLAQGHTLATVALSQTHALAAADVAHAFGLEGLLLDSTAALSPVDLAHVQLLDGLVLDSVAMLALDNLAHDHVLDAMALTQTHMLAPAAIVHGHLLDDRPLFSGDGGNANYRMYRMRRRA